MATMKFRPIIVDNNQQELTQHGMDEFPMSMDEQQVNGCALIPHWHYEVQISVVTKGSVKFQTQTGEYLLHEGEGFFTNSGVLHETIQTKDKDSVYVCVNFKPNLIYGQADSAIRKDYVDPVLFSTEMQSFPLQSAPWHQEICNLVLELGRVNNEQEYGYELEMKILLSKIWHTLIINNRDIIEKATPISFSDKQRMKAMQDFIRKNYSEKISLEDIAKAAHISRGECCRVFKRIQRISPMLYLMHYRVAQGVKLLTCMDLNVSEIAFQTGFSSSSYFTECFREEMKCTPLEYRKLHRNDGHL
jgi:AraC-like DNA-binding protein/mannose-6-phosphate isomerase-like protein (cupin superfamily)